VLDRFPDLREGAVNEIGLIAFGLLSALAIWRLGALTRGTSARERIWMRAAAWSILEESAEDKSEHEARKATRE
jgi:hypothetical protein